MNPMYWLYKKLVWPVEVKKEDVININSLDDLFKELDKRKETPGEVESFLATFWLKLGDN